MSHPRFSIRSESRIFRIAGLDWFGMNQPYDYKVSVI